MNLGGWSAVRKVNQACTIIMHIFMWICTAPAQNISASCSRALVLVCGICPEICSPARVYTLICLELTSPIKRCRPKCALSHSMEIIFALPWSCVPNIQNVKNLFQLMQHHALLWNITNMSENFAYKFHTCASWAIPHCQSTVVRSIRLQRYSNMQQIGNTVPLLPAASYLHKVSPRRMLQNVFISGVYFKFWRSGNTLTQIWTWESCNEKLQQSKQFKITQRTSKSVQKFSKPTNIATGTNRTKNCAPAVNHTNIPKNWKLRNLNHWSLSVLAFQPCACLQHVRNFFFF